MARITVRKLNKIWEEINRQNIREYCANTKGEELEARTKLRELYNRLSKVRAEMVTVCYLIDEDDVGDMDDIVDYMSEAFPCFIHFSDSRYANAEECSITTYPEYLRIVEELLKDFV